MKKNIINQAIMDAMSKDPGNWRGLFYVNRKDPRLIVPKLYPSLGWTLNFGKPAAWAAIAAIAAMIVVISLLEKI